MSKASLARILWDRQALHGTKGLGTSRKTDVDRWIREDEVRRILAMARSGSEPWGPTSYDAFLFAANLGLRAGEIVDLRLTDFSDLYSHNAILVRSGKSARRDPLKARDLLEMTPQQLAVLRERLAREESSPRQKRIDTIYVSDAEKDILLDAVGRRRRFASQDYRQRLFPFSKRYFQYLFDYYRARAGLRPGLSPHALRRFVASRLASITGESRLAAARLRHRESVTFRYIDFPPERQIELLGRVEPMQ